MATPYDDNQSDDQSPRPVDTATRADGASTKGHSSVERDSVRAREREAFGGIKPGVALLGWLTTVGATLVLTAVVAAVVTGLGLDDGVSTQNLRDVGIGAAIVLLAILVVAYYTGGYVAGRMARFNGLRQGVAVWVWAVLIAIVLTVIGVVVGNETDITSQVNLPPLPVDSDDLSTRGLVALAIVLAATLVAAMLGGLAGMRFHRRVDKAGFDLGDDD